jgi:hypothetical protein
MEPIIIIPPPPIIDNTNSIDLLPVFSTDLSNNDNNDGGSKYD